MKNVLRISDACSKILKPPPQIAIPVLRLQNLDYQKTYQLVSLPKEDDENYIVSLFSNQDDLAWETLDRRKRVRIDLSLPVGLTMGWKSTQQEKVYLLQEFDIPKGRSTCSFNSSRVANSSCSIREKQLVSTTNFVSGGGKMAVQKLFPGPVQALRLSLVLVYDEFDYKEQKWVEKSKNIEMGSGDFFYLKILFSKEST